MSPEHVRDADGADNVFVLCTGRCGSVTFSKACAHIENFTTGHETLAEKLGPERVAYPARHIEVDNRLAWFLPRLGRAFPDALYVHLWRDEQAVAESYNRRWTSPVAMMPAYRNGILKLARGADALDVCLDMVRNVELAISEFLTDKASMDFPLSEAKALFPELWRRIGAEGDLSLAVAEWDILHNPSRPPPAQTASGTS